MKTNFKSYAVRFTGHSLKPFMPETMAEHVRNGGALYVVDKPHENGQVFVSTHADPCGHLCTFVPMAMLTRIPVEAAGDKSFIKEEAIVYCVYPESETMPVLTGRVEAIYEDDSADIDIPYLGSTNIDFKAIFKTQAEAIEYYISIK